MRLKASQLRIFQLASPAARVSRCFSGVDLAIHSVALEADSRNPNSIRSAEQRTAQAATEEFVKTNPQERTHSNILP